MSDKFTFGSAGEIQDVEFALARNGWNHPLLKRATGGDFFGLVREVLEGRAEICRIERLAVADVTIVTAPQHLIDCDAVPMIPSSLRIEAEDQLAGRVRGQLIFDPANIVLYLSTKQQGGKVMNGHQLLKELASKGVYTANVLDYLLAHQELIPKSWKGKAVFFFGTIYRGSSGSLYVRCLHWSGERWISSCYWLGDGWHGDSPSAVHAS